VQGIILRIGAVSIRIHVKKRTGQRGHVHATQVNHYRRGRCVSWLTPFISNNDANAAQSRVQVVPLTSNTSRVYAWEALVTVDGKPAKANQIGAVTKERLDGYIGTLTRPEVLAVEQAIRLQLGLP